MKFIFTLRLALVIGILAAILKGSVAAQPAPAPPPSNPSQFQKRLEELMKSSRSAVDPVNGFPVPPKTDDLISSNWADTGQRLDITIDNLPVTEVAKMMRENFKDAFDTIIPGPWKNPYIAGNTFSPDTVTVKLALKNVAAVEMFNAMNLEFEAENTPVRWELKMNGDRRLALLRVIPALIPSPPPVYEKKQTVFFVGDLVDSTPELFRTVLSVYDMAYDLPANRVSPEELRYHAEAQLLIVNAPVDRIGFVLDTLKALREKLRLENMSKPKPAPAPNK